MAPTVSVVIPAYNAAAFIAAALDSVFAQTRPADEVIVVNDGSPDTPALEQALASCAGRIVLLTQENGGPSAARNRGVLAARSEYVAFLDSDDTWVPTYLETQLGILAAAPADLLYSNGVIVGNTPEAGRQLMSLSPSRGPATFDALVTLRCTVLTSCVVARRQALIDAGLFDPRFRRAEDFHLWARVAHRGGLVRYHTAVLVRHTKRRGSLSHDEDLMTKGAIEVFEDLHRTLPLSPREAALVSRQIRRFRSQLALRQGKRAFLVGDNASAAAAIGRAAALEPAFRFRTRLRALQAGLRLAPGLLRRTYGMLRRPVPARQTGGA
ncbi:MAG TPA: glycosyltransferase family 2 protein [Vicinamibacterales bacterium]|nr:glycosyltransferase family 2 protein [Vicinamibacterales bacterium]